MTGGRRPLNGRQHLNSFSKARSMDPVDYKYCPVCAAGLEPQAHSGSPRPTCPACGFVHYQDPKVAVVALIHWQGQVLMIQRRFGRSKGCWALPGGFMDPGEMPDDAVQREVREEVGLTVCPETLLGILPMEVPGPGKVGIVLAYAAALQSAPPARLSGADDAAAADWFHPASLPDALAFKGTRRLIRQWHQHQSGMPDH